MFSKTSQLSRQTETPQKESENEKSSLTQSERAISTLLTVGERILYISNVLSMLSAFQPVPAAKTLCNNYNASTNQPYCEFPKFSDSVIC